MTQPLETNNTTAAKGERIISPEFPRKKSASKGRHDNNTRTPASGSNFPETNLYNESLNEGNESRWNSRLNRFYQIC